MLDFLATGQSDTSTSKRVGVSRAALGHFKKKPGKEVPPCPPSFFHPEKEKLFSSFVSTKALLGQDVTRDGFLACCREEVAATSLDRQQIARRYFNRTLTPGRGFYHLFLSRLRQLTKDRAGSLEESRAKSALPDVVVRWHAAKKLS